MDHLHRALAFSEWAIEIVAVPPACFITMLAAGSLAWASQKQRPFTSGLWKRHYWLAFTHLLFFHCAIAVGVMWENPWNNWNVGHQANLMVFRLVDWLFYGSVVSYIFWAWRMKGFRWYAISLLTLFELPILGAIFVAEMSVSGRWL